MKVTVVVFSLAVCFMLMLATLASLEGERRPNWVSFPAPRHGVECWKYRQTIVCFDAGE